MSRLAFGLLAALLVSLASPGASADSIASLSKKLRTHKDAQVRTKAALSLGATAHEGAVRPLCSGLNDSKSKVRAASAAALGKLSLGGTKCLDKRLDAERQKNVKRMIKKALKKIRAALDGPRLNGKTRFYVALGKVKGDRGKVRGALKRDLASRSGYAMAPDGETKAQANKRLRKHPSVQGYFFEPTLTIKKGKDSVEVILAIAIFDYPKREQLGSVSRSLGRTGIDPKDEELVDALVRKVTDETVDAFAKMADDA